MSLQQDGITDVVVREEILDVITTVKDGALKGFNIFINRRIK